MRYSLIWFSVVKDFGASKYNPIVMHTCVFCLFTAILKGLKIFDMLDDHFGEWLRMLDMISWWYFNVVSNDQMNIPKFIE